MKSEPNRVEEKIETDEAETNTQNLISDIKSETKIVEVKIETQSDSEAESEIDLYTDHEIKEEMVIGPVLLQPAVYNYKTNCSKACIEAPSRLNTNSISSSSLHVGGEPSCEPRFVLKPVIKTYCRPGRNTAALRPLDAHLPKKPRQEAKDDKTDQVKPQGEMKEITTIDDLNKSTFTDIETRETVTNEEAIKNVNLQLNNEIICDVNGCKYFGEKYTLAAHIESHEKIQQDHLKCKKAQAPLENYNLMKHLDLKKYIYSDKVMRKCSVCDYRTNDINNLKKHLQCHSKRKRFLCNFCEYNSSRKADLVRHIRTHTGEKPFSCSFCLYKCAFKTQLVIHTRTHTGHKPYGCTACEYESHA